MDVRQIPLGDIGEHELACWRRLAASALEPNPFFEPEYLMPQARACGALTEVALVVVIDGNAWAACMPVRAGRGWHRIPISAVSTWRGRPAIPALLGVPLIDRGVPSAAASALVESLLAGEGGSFVALEWLVEDGPVYGAIRDAIAGSASRCIEFERFDRAFLRRRPDADYFERSMKGKHRGVMRRRWRKLEQQLGGPPVVVDLSGDESAVEELMEIEGASRLAARGMVLKADPAYERFFREMCAGFSAAGRLQLHALRCADRTVATRCNLVAGPGTFYLKVAYDEALADFSPGIRLEVESFDLFHRRAESEWVDACSDPNNETMNRLLPDRRPLITLVLVRSDARGRATAAAIRGAKYLRERRMARVGRGAI